MALIQPNFEKVPLVIQILAKQHRGHFMGHPVLGISHHIITKAY